MAAQPAELDAGEHLARRRRQQVQVHRPVLVAHREHVRVVLEVPGLANLLDWPPGAGALVDAA